MALIAHTFEDDAEHAAAVARLRVLVGGGAAGTGGAEGAGVADVPVLAALRALVPGGVLRRGGVLAVEDRVRPWGDAPSYLALALAAGASAGGAWCGVVGLPAFGIAAASGMGADLGRFLMLDEPGERWAEAVAVLAGAVDLVLVRPPRRPGGEQVRRIGARLRRTVRQRGAALVVAGEWPGADLRLRLTESAWSGLGDGTGHLTGRRVAITAAGRGAAGRERTARLWLPAADGAVREWAAETDAPGLPGDRAEQRFGVSAQIRDGGEVVRLWSA
ncbi:hypothetical protein ABH935_006121 [Catenulispora sp. GAS73]|uniref:hypothetical protein n=1 Tax=Catenulispora sp. GAS73 TaxID=3156269 RepID=UPI003515F028